MKILPKLTLTLALLTAFALPSYSAPIHALGDADPAAAGFNTGGVGNAARGWRFTAGANDTWITQLGINTPQGALNSGRTVTLWDFSSQTILAQTTFSAGAGWLWNNISAVALTNGSDYLVEYHSATMADYWFRSGLPSNWYPTGVINYQDMKFCNGCSANDFPLNTLSGYQYGVPDIGYEMRLSNDVPEPASLALLGLGLMGVAAARRRKS